MDYNLETISGIVAATGVIIEVLKRLIQNKAPKWIQCIPVWVFAVIVSAALSLLANKVLISANGTPLLEGNTWQVMWSAAVSAAGASGFYTWLKNPETMSTVSSGMQRKRCP